MDNSKKALRARAGRNRDKRSEQPKLAYYNPVLNMGDEGIRISKQGHQYARPTAPPQSFKR